MDADGEIRRRSAEALLARCRKNVVYIDKLSELLKKLDREFSDSNAEKNLLDYNDLEHLTLTLLDDEQAASGAFAADTI